MSSIRINKYIASTGSISRRKADGLLREGRIAINGRRSYPGDMVDPDTDEVSLDGRPVRPQRAVYLVAYKPRNVVTTMYDPQGRPCVKDIIPKRYEGVFPVGRLDFDAEGLLLLTNDGGLAQALHHPSFSVPKTYIVRMVPQAGSEQMERMRSGIVLDGVRTRPAEIELMRSDDRGSTLRITLRQGLKNQIKRMAGAVGLEVRSIKRVSVGPATLKGISPGQVRELSPREIDELHKILKKHKKP